LDFVAHLIRLGSENILERDFVAFLIRPDRIVQGSVLSRFFERTEAHEDLILDAAVGESGEFRAFADLKAFDRFDQPHRADGNEVLQISQCYTKVRL
jgi:hypothetical protein